MQVVLLAAGMGVRLGPLTKTLPKALIPVNQHPLIDYSLSHILKNQGVEEVIVVGGFEYFQLKAHLQNQFERHQERIKLLENKKFQLGNLHTLHTALPALKTSFLICNVDHLYSQKAWDFILQDRPEVSIFCDFKRPLAADEMKVQLDGKGQLKAMSKTLKDFEGGYVGLTYVPQEFFESYKTAVENTFLKFEDNAVVENVLPLLTREGKAVHPIAFDEYPWHEVDTPEDLKKAEAALYTP